MREMILTYVITNCCFFKRGMQELFSGKYVNFAYASTISDLKIPTTEKLQVILAVELTTLVNLKNFWDIVNFLTHVEKARVGIVITKNNAYLMHYLSHRIAGVTFFMPIKYVSLLMGFIDGAMVTHIGK